MPVDAAIATILTALVEHAPKLVDIPPAKALRLYRTFAKFCPSLAEEMPTAAIWVLRRADRGEVVPNDIRELVEIEASIREVIPFDHDQMAYDDHWVGFQAGVIWARGREDRKAYHHGEVSEAFGIFYEDNNAGFGPGGPGSHWPGSTTKASESDPTSRDHF